MNMKRLITLAVAGLMLWACQPEAFKEIGPAYSVVDGIEGSWSLAMVEVQDRTLPLWETIEFTDYFQANPVQIDFNATNNTYSITANSLDGLPLSSMSGTYAFDDPEYPSNLHLISGTDTNTVKLGNMVRAIDPNLLLEELKENCDAVYARYTYTFNRVN